MTRYYREAEKVELGEYKYDGSASASSPAERESNAFELKAYMKRAIESDNA